MSKKGEFKPHIIALSALFVLGNGILLLPLKGADSFSFLAFLITVPILVAVFLWVDFIWSRLWDTEQGSGLLKRIAYCVLLTAVAVFSAFAGAETFGDLIRFAREVILPETGGFFITAVLGVTVIFFITKRSEAILKFSLICGVLVAFIIVFFFLASVDKYDWRNIFVFRLPSINELLKQIKPYLFNPVLQIIILPIYLKASLNSSECKKGAAGVIVGSMLLGLVVLSPILLFSPQIAGELTFPFSSAVSTVTVGRLFTRLDGFSYFTNFVCALVKITVCADVIKFSLNKLSIMVKRR